MSAFASTSTYSFQAKDAAAREREDRLLAAKKKLKQYRARTSQRLGSTSSTSTDFSSPARTRRQSGSISSQADFTAKHAHRRSQSKSGLLAAMGGDAFVGGGAASPGHARRMSKSRASRSSISLVGGVAGAKKGHGHNRSRASISMSFSGPDPVVPPPSNNSIGHTVLEMERSITPTPRAASGLGTPASWLQSSSGFPTSPDLARASLGNGIKRSTSPLPPSPAPGPQPVRHGRQGSRHARNLSVSNFRESLDLVGGGKNNSDPSLLHPALSSFASTHDGAVSPSTAASSSPVAANGWPSDPHQVLAALKERGRRESEDQSLSPEQTRQFALEALEGRVSAPSEMISLGTAPAGELLTAPKSPGYTLAAATSPLPVTASFTAGSPMIGLGVSGNANAAGKRSSWGPQLGGVAGVGAQGVMELGGIAEEDEEEEEEYSRRTGKSPVSSPKRASPSPRKGRPTSIVVEPRRIESVIATTMSRQSTQSPQTSPTMSRRSSIRPLSLSLSSNTSSAGTPSTTNGPFGRRDSLQAPSSPDDMRTPSSPGEQRRISMFHTAAALGLDPSSTPPSTQSALASRGGLRSLSIGAHSPTPASERRLPGRPSSVSTSNTASPSSAHTVVNLSASAPPSSTPRVKPSPALLQKRSSLTYRTTTTPESQRRLFNSSVSSTPGKDVSPSVSTSTYTFFPFGVAGGFGDLEVDSEYGDSSSAQPSPSRPSFAGSTGPTSTRSTSTASAAAAAAAAAEEVASLRMQLSALESRNSQLASTHALEIEEFERKASDEAGEMRARITVLEQQLDEERTARRFENEGLQREAEMAKEAVGDLTDERDALREDVDGWRARCANLESVVKKEREDEALAQAQAKLIGEMRDQIYTLVAALERERGEHGETRREVERMLEERVREAAAEANGMKGGANGRPDDLALIMEEEEEDDDDYEDVDDDEEVEQEMPPQLQQPQRLAGAPSRHPYKGASEGSMLSTGSSTFSRSFSGNTTEDTSVGTDYEDYNKLSSPPSGQSSFSASVGGAFPPPASANPNRNSDTVAAALGQLDTLAEEDEEDEEAAYGATPAATSTPLHAQQQQQTPLPAHGSMDSTTSTSSDVMPRTPERSQVDHNRSHSFIRHWSFPRGSVTSARPSMEDEDSSFFGYNKHDSLPALQIDQEKHIEKFSALLTSTLDIDEDQFHFFPPQPIEGTVETASHVRRPSSPRPNSQRFSNPIPHARRVSGQLNKAPPPPAPSAIVSAALQHQPQRSLHHQPHPSAASSVSSGVSPDKSTSRYSFGALVGSISGWSPSSSTSLPAHPNPPLRTNSQLSMSTSSRPPAVAEVREEEEVEESDGEGIEEDVFITTHSVPSSTTISAAPLPPPPPPHAAATHGTPVQLQHQNQHQNRLRYIAKNEVPRPVKSRLALLNFTRSVCCLDEPVFVV